MPSPVLEIAVLARTADEAQQLRVRLQSPRLSVRAFVLGGPVGDLEASAPVLTLVSLAGAEVSEVVAAASAPGRALVLVGEVPWPALWWAGFSTGVVGVLAPAALDADALVGLAASLRTRPGAIRGSGTFGELPGFLEALAAVRRTGTLVVRSVTEGAGRAELVLGQPREARYGLRSGPEAWAALQASRGSWEFREHGTRVGPAVRDRAELDHRGTRLALVGAELAPQAAHLAHLGFEVLAVRGSGQAREVVLLDGVQGLEPRPWADDEARLRGQAAVRARSCGVTLQEVEEAVQALLVPRAEVLAQLRAWQLEEAVRLEVEAVGLTWLVRQLALEGITGTLELRGGPLAVRAWFAGGRLCQASGEDGLLPVVGFAALEPLLSRRDLLATLEVGGLPEGEGFGGVGTEAVLEALAARTAGRASGVHRAA
jgi:hypothetical protein